MSDAQSDEYRDLETLVVQAVSSRDGSIQDLFPKLMNNVGAKFTLALVFISFLKIIIDALSVAVCHCKL